MNAEGSRTVAEWVARFLVDRGVDRVYGLQGGHIQPIWDHLARRDVRIVDNAEELTENRRGDAEVFAHPALALAALADAVPARKATDPARLRAAIEEALAKAPALIDVVVTRDTVSTDAAKGLGFLHDYQALTPWNEAEEARRS